MLRLLLLVALLTSCRNQRDLSQYVEEDPLANLSTHVELGNPQQASQLKSGFHQIEQGGWRWVAKSFTVQLKPPFASQKLGARLTLAGNFPEILFSKTGPLQLSAKLNNTVLSTVTFTHAGEVSYNADVPASALQADTILVTFTTDKSIAPNTLPGDGRELALIVSSIALETKK